MHELKFASTSCSRYGNIISTKAILHKDTNQCKGLHIYSIFIAYETSQPISYHWSLCKPPENISKPQGSKKRRDIEKDQWQ